MEFIIKREKLLKSLFKTQGIVERKLTKPVLGNVLLEVRSGRMYFAATDLEIGVHGSCEVEVVKEGRIALLAGKALEIVRELSGEEVSLRLKEPFNGGRSVEMLCGRAVFNINSVDPENYPALPTHEGVSLFPIDLKKIKDMIRKTIFAASTDERRRNINGAFFMKDGKRITMVCTDGHRLAIVEEENSESESLSLDKGVVFPRKGLRELVRILDEDKKESKVYFGFKGNNGIFRVGDVSMIMRLVDSEFPDYSVFIPRDNDKRLLINRNAFIMSLKRVSLLSREGSKAVRFSLSLGKMEMMASSSDYGEAYDYIELDYGGEDLTAAFNAGYFIEALGVFDSEEVLMELKDSESGAVLSPAEGDRHRCVIMPMRI